jgi:hypothetical protein
MQLPCSDKLLQEINNVILFNDAVMLFKEIFVCLFDGVQHHFQQYFSYIMAVSFIGRENRRTQRKPLTCRKSLTNFIT